MTKLSMKLLVTLFLCVSISFFANAQDDGDPDIPLDPGSWVLVAAGVGYGVKKMLTANKKPANSSPDATTNFIQKENVDESRF